MKPVDPLAAAPSGDGSGGFVAVVVMMTVLVLILAVAVKLYDLKRKRDDEAVSLQARISDALLVEPMFAGVAITPTVRIPLWRGSPATVELAGTVVRPQLRESAIELVIREMSRDRTDCRIEDRLVVDPILLKHAA